MNAPTGRTAKEDGTAVQLATGRRMASSPRRLAGLHLLYGAGLLAAASTHLQRPGDAAGRESARQARLFARTLGVRNLLQALLIARRPTRTWIRASAATDGLHAASMILLARASPRWRRSALTSAVAASLLCTCAVTSAVHADDSFEPARLG
ncbi:MAG: hypothetical protein ACRDK7_15350 [Solirubrobacteraceae bacterium]